MKRTMKAAIMLLCTFALTVMTTGCSSDNNEVEHQKSAEQVLNNMVGIYEGTLGFTYGTSTATSSSLGWKTNCKVDKDHNIIFDQFPYHTLANGVSKKGLVGAASPLLATLQKVENSPLKIKIEAVGLNYNRTELFIVPDVKFNVTGTKEIYELSGQIRPSKNNYYTMSTSEINIEFTVNKLVRINKEHGTALVENDFDMPVTYYLKVKRVK